MNWISDLGAKFTAGQTLKLFAETNVLPEGQKRATEELFHLQGAVHWIEAFMVSVYAADLPKTSVRGMMLRCHHFCCRATIDLASPAA